MKKLFLGLALVAASFTFAQKKGTSPISYGLKAGMNVSSFSKDSGSDVQESKVGFYAGGFANIPLSAQFSVQPELLYSGLGAKKVETFSGQSQNTTFNSTRKSTASLDYLAVPVMFQYNATPRLYLEAGPEFGFMLSAKEKVSTTMVAMTGNSSSTTTTETSGKIDKKDLKTFNFGLGLGAGYYFTPNIGVTLRYVAGLTDVVKNRPSGSDAVKNNVLQVGVAYKF